MFVAAIASLPIYLPMLNFWNRIYQELSNEKHPMHFISWNSNKPQITAVKLMCITPGSLFFSFSWNIHGNLDYLFMKYVTKTHLKQGIHIVALFLETRIVFFRHFEKNSFEVIAPLLFKLHTGFWNCVLSEFIYIVKPCM